MSESRRIWVVHLSEGYRAAVPSEPLHAALSEPVNLEAGLLLDGWQAPSLEWHAKSPKQPIPDIAVPLGYGSLLFRRSVVPTLFPTSTAALEFLPATVDGEDWVILHCLRSIEAVDRRSSDLWTLELPSGRTQILEARWINVTDPAAIALEVFCLRAEPQLPLLCTDAFVDRVHRLGLRGLDFKHVGYIVADASLAVPKPPAPPPPAARASKRKPPQLSSVPLPAGEQIELAEVCAKWRQRLQLSDEMAPEAVLQRITQEMRKLRLVFSTVSPEERIDIVLGLSAVYGELLRSACGWSWAEVREGRSKRSIAMLAPSGAHALALMPYLQQQIQSESPTVTLLFNMIAAGQLPPAEPRQLVLVA